ncbi:g11190 [Coccomyxa elongata]
MRGARSSVPHPLALLTSPLQQRPVGRLKSLFKEIIVIKDQREKVGRESRGPVVLQESTGPAAISQEKTDADRKELEKITTVLPPRLAGALLERPDFCEVVELVMDLGRPPLARFPSGDLKLSSDVITQQDLAYAIEKLGAFGDDNRAGIDRTLHRISCMRNRDGRIIGLTCRAGRAIPGSASMAADLIASGRSILFMGRPGVGKTTVIRETSRLLSQLHQKRVVIVDTSNEIGGDGDIAHIGIGRARRMQVSKVAAQHRTMIEAVENHMPEVVVVDEIGTEAEALAARSIAQRGVQLVATAHGAELARLIKNPTLSDLIGGIQAVTLSDDEAKRRKGPKTVIERMAPPTFDTAVEIIDRCTWRVHLDLAAAVDSALKGHEVEGQLRVQREDGSVEIMEGGAYWDDDASSTSSSTSALFDQESIAAERRSGGAGAESTWSTVGWFGGAVDAAAIAILPHGLDGHAVKDVIAGMGLERSVLLTPHLHEADAVLTVRERLRGGGDDLVNDARAAGQAIFSMKSGSPPSIIKAIRALAGIDPSPFSLRDVSAAVDADPSSRKRVAALRSEHDIARMTGRSNIVSKTNYKKKSAALEEAKAAVEELVLAGGHAAELLPRSPDILSAQEDLVRSYNLPFEVVGSDSDTRLRILPQHYISGDNEHVLGTEWDARSSGWHTV